MSSLTPSLTCSFGTWRAPGPWAPICAWGSYTESRESWFPLLTLIPLLPLHTKRPYEIKYWQTQKEIYIFGIELKLVIMRDFEVQSLLSLSKDYNTTVSPLFTPAEVTELWPWQFCKKEIWRV